ncbi:MAG TPA: prepilin-type N-terminal cleavage/methylation domain-containing protein [bacterium]|nr:prepilin-type N-terminal cleavage/methylation domain-containing protein [bacterium]
MMRNQQGFSLLEILVSLAIFAVIAIGALGVIGASDAGGFLEGFPSAFITARVARDYTAGSVYLQSLQEYVQSKGNAAAAPGTYCKGAGCSPEVELPAGYGAWGVYPTPPGEPYQLQWSKMELRLERWYWDDTAKVYKCAEPSGTSDLSSPPRACSFTLPSPAPEYVVRAQARLTWTVRGVERALIMERFFVGASP